MAVAPAAAFLQLSHHGWAGDLLCVANADCRLSALAWQAVYYPLGAMAADAQLSSSVHCKHCGMDDRGDRAAAMGCLWTDSHIRGLFQTCFGRKRPVYSAWIHGHVQRAFHSVCRPDLSNCAAGTRRGGWHRGTGGGELSLRPFVLE